MRKRIMGSMLLVSLTAAAVLGGCKKQEEVPEYDSSQESMYILGDGTIDTTTIGTFDQDYYDIDEYTDFVKERIQAYNQENADLPFASANDTEEQLPVSYSEISEKDGTVTMKLVYDSADSYLAFNQEYQGLSEDAYIESCLTGDQSADLSGVTFVSATDQTAVENDTALKVYEKDTKKTHFVGVNFSTELYTENAILYVSDSDSVEITGKNSVSITTDGEPVYIIYK